MGIPRAGHRGRAGGAPARLQRTRTCCASRRSRRTTSAIFCFSWCSGPTTRCTSISRPCASGLKQGASSRYPSRNLVMPLDRLEAEARFRQEVRYWERAHGIALAETNMEAERINQIASSPHRPRRRGRPSCGGIFDFDGKQSGSRAVRRELEDPERLERPEARAGARQGEEGARGVVGTLATIDSRPARRERAVRASRARRTTTPRWSAIAADVDEAREATSRSSSSAACSPTRSTRTTASSTSRPAPAAPRRRTGRRCCCACTCKYCERKGFKAEVLEADRRARSPASRARPSRSTATTPTATCAPRPACTAWCARSRSIRNARRHTSFASVFVYPEVDESIEIEINPADLRIDTYRASGAGGQHVNKTDSAVRITHMPDRHRRAVPERPLAAPQPRRGMAMLKSRLYELELRKRKAEQQTSSRTRKTDIGWGHQIRSYVLDQSRIKDLRTGVEIGNTQTRARRRPRRLHRGKPEAGGVSMEQRTTRTS